MTESDISELVKCIHLQADIIDALYNLLAQYKAIDAAETTGITDKMKEAAKIVDEV